MGEDGGSQAGCWLGGEVAQKEPKPAVEEAACGGEQAMEACGGPAALLELQSEALSLENMVMASGKLGGVAGVFLGVHICGGVSTTTRKHWLEKTTCRQVCETAEDSSHGSAPGRVPPSEEGGDSVHQPECVKTHT